MKKVILICLYLITSVIIISCDPLKPGYKDCEVNGYTNYQFNLPFYYSPSTDTIQLGDTLWIESTFSNQLLNENNGKTYTLNDFKFGLYGAINDLSTNPTIGYSEFVLIDTIGQIDNEAKMGVYFNIDFKYADNFYYWKRGIVFKKTGAFFININSDMIFDVLSKTGQSITKCPNEYVNPIGKPMNVNNNYYLTESSPDPYIKQGQESFKNSYTFYVK